jgi:hypothetical protein
LPFRSSLCQIKIPSQQAVLIPTAVAGDTAVVIPYVNAVEYYNLKSRLWPTAVSLIDSLRLLSVKADSLINGQKEEISKNKLLLANETLARQKLEATLAEADEVLRKKRFAVRFWRLAAGVATAAAVIFAVK